MQRPRGPRPRGRARDVDAGDPPRREVRGRSSFATWVYRIAIHRCRDAVRREGRHAVLRSQSGSHARRVSRSLVVDAASEDSQPDRLGDVLGLLWQPDREALLLCHMRGMTHEQAASVLGIPLGTLKTRVHRAMRQLRGSLETEEPTP
ncbi:MAG: RNA polymerase sigma factor [Planctomycetota bacterium]